MESFFLCTAIETEDVRPGLILKAADHQENWATFSYEEYQEELRVMNSTLEVLGRD